MHRQRGGQGLSLRLTLDADMPESIETDESKVRQILSNLIGNALKYTDEGSVTVSARWEDAGEGGLDAIVLEVADTGIGIPPEEFERVFEPFTQLHGERSSREGVGLGLTIARRYAELLEGTLAIQNRDGGGTSFTLSIPCRAVNASRADMGAGERRVTGLEAGQPGHRVLVVEDDPDSRAILRQLLQSVGFEVREAETGEQAVELHAEWRPDLIWMDIRLPGITGLEAVSLIRKAEGETEQTADCPTHTCIIALSASVFESDREKVLATDCDGFIRKPFVEQEIFTTMAEHLGVRYLYEETTDETGLVSDRTLSHNDLASLPDGWLQSVRDAAAKGQSPDLTNLVRQIRQEHSVVAGALDRMIGHYEFRRIVGLTEGREDSDA